MLVALLATMVLLSVLQIANRQLFDGSLAIAWSDELIRIIVLWLAMVGSIAAARDNKHIRIDAISHLLPQGALRWIRAIVDLFAAAVSGFVAYQAWRLTVMEREWGDMAAIDVPMWVLHAVVPVAFALISYRFVVRVAQAIAGVEADKTAEHSS